MKRNLVNFTRGSQLLGHFSFMFAAGLKGPLIVAAIGGGLAGCGLPDSEYFGPVPTVDDPRHLRWCNAGEPDSLDPAEGQSTTVTPLMYALFDGLLIYGDDGLPTAGVVINDVLSPEQAAKDLSTATNRLEISARSGAPILAHVSYGGESFSEAIDWCSMAGTNKPSRYERGNQKLSQRRKGAKEERK